MQGIELSGHPRDAPRRIEAHEAHRSMLGIEPSGHPRDGPRKAKGAPLPKQIKTEHPREARNPPADHPRDASRRMEAQEAHRSTLGIEPSGHPRDAPTEAKEAPLPRHGETKHPGSMPGIGSDGHPRDEPKEMDTPLPKHGKRLFIQASLF
jgi:hypothetical protein